MKFKLEPDKKEYTLGKARKIANLSDKDSLSAEEIARRFYCGYKIPKEGDWDDLTAVSPVYSDPNAEKITAYFTATLGLTPDQYVIQVEEDDSDNSLMNSKYRIHYEGEVFVTLFDLERYGEYRRENREKQERGIRELTILRMILQDERWVSSKGKEETDAFYSAMDTVMENWEEVSFYAYKIWNIASWLREHGGESND